MKTTPFDAQNQQIKLELEGPFKRKPLLKNPFRQTNLICSYKPFDQ